MWPQTLDPRNPWCYLLVNQSRLTPKRCPLCRLNITNVYLSIGYRLDSHGFIALTIHLQRRLVLVVGSTNLSQPYLFFKKYVINLL